MDLTDLSLQREIAALREVYLQSEREKPSARDQFEYAMALSCSPHTSDNMEAIELFSQLSSTNHRPRDCSYHTALIYLKLGRYKHARQAIEQALRLNPRDFAALSLRSAILVRTAREGVMGSLTMFTFTGLLLGGSYLALKLWVRSNAAAPAS